MARKQIEVNIDLSSIGIFPTHWKECRLEDVCILVTDGTHDSPKESLDGFPLVTGKSIKGRFIDFSNTYNISSEDHAKVIARSKAEKDDLLFANIGNSIGDLVRIDTKREFSIKNLALFKPNKTVIHPRYLEYYFFSSKVQSYIKNSTSGSAQPFIGLGTLRAFPVALPPLGEQKIIAKWLGDIDDKVTLNTQTNQTLEDMAQAIFKSWFVDFEPVKAKINGEQPEGMDATTASLFPEKLVESEIGLIPEGWVETPLYDIAEYINGAAYKKFEPNNEGIGLPIVKIAELKAGITQKTGFSTVDMPAKYRLEDNDILFSWSGNPDTSIDTFVWALGEAWLNQHIFKVVPKSVLSRDYVLCLLKFMRPVFAEIARDKQTTGLGHVTVKDLKRLTVALPSEELLTKFNEKVSAIIAQNFSLVKQNQNLEKLRDTLLPKLLSGEIELGKCEHIVN